MFSKTIAVLLFALAFANTLYADDDSTSLPEAPLPQKEDDFDYCDDTATKCGNTHIGCDHYGWDGGWGPDCTDGTVLPMTAKVKQRIVDIHNEIRNKQALGEVSEHYETAEIMVEMIWDDALADLAQLHARGCVMEHDHCRNTKKWWLAGQNLYSGFASMDEPIDTEDRILEWVEKYSYGWFDGEWPNGEYFGWMDAINGNYSENDDQADKQIGHWTCQVQDISQAIGCALTTYRSSYDGTDYWGVLFTCNYALSNIGGRPAYQPGEPTSKCHETSDNYPGLCANGGSYKLFDWADYP